MLRQGVAELLRGDASYEVVLEFSDPTSAETSLTEIDTAIVELTRGESVAEVVGRLAPNEPLARLVLWHPGPERRSTERPTGSPRVVIATADSSITEVIGDRPATAPRRRPASSWSSPEPTIVLSPRLAGVLSLVAEGLTTREIAERLGIGMKTVEHHKQSLFAKLAVHSRFHAISVALRLGLLPGDPAHIRAGNAAQTVTGTC